MAEHLLLHPGRRVRAAVVDDAYVIHDATNGRLNVLNPSAAVIWLACDGTTDLDGVIDTVAEATGMDRASLAADVTTAVEAMTQAGLVQWAPTPSSPEEARELSGDCGCAPPVRRRGPAAPEALVVDLGGGTLAVGVLGDDDVRAQLDEALREAGVQVTAEAADAASDTVADTDTDPSAGAVAGAEHDLMHVHVGAEHVTVTRWDGGTWPRARTEALELVLWSIAEHPMLAPGGLRLRARVDEVGPGAVALHVDAEAEPVGVLPDGRITRGRVAPPDRVVAVTVPGPLPPGPTPLVQAVLAIGRDVTDLDATGRGTLDDLARIVRTWPPVTLPHP